MSDQLELDFWDRLVLQPSARPEAATSDERLILAIDELFPAAASPTARTRARHRIFHDSRSLNGPISRPTRIQSKTAAATPRSQARWREAPRWAMLAAALLVLIGAIGIWAGAGSWPNQSSQSNGGIIPAVPDKPDNVVMRGVNPGRTNTVAGPAPRSTPSVGWVYTADDNIATVPLVVDGVVYAGESSDSPQDPGAILAIRASDGLLLWSFPTEHGLSAAFAYDRGVLFAVDDNGVIYAVDALNGTERWQSDVRGDQPYQFTYFSDLLLVDEKLVFTTGSVLAVAASADAIFVGNPSPDWFEGEPHVYAVSTLNGSVLWDVTDYPDDDRGGVSALSLEDGLPIWDHSDAPAVLGPAYADDLIYFGTNNPATLVALDAATGMERWRTVASYTGEWNSRISFAIAADEVIAGAPSGELIAVDRATGEPTLAMSLFVDDFSASASSGVVVAGNVAIATNVGYDNLGESKAVDLSDHSVLWQISFGACRWAIPVVADGRVFQIAFEESSDNGTLVMLEIPADSS